jgi:peptidoglycan/LPS O-acetylase OafA/YrhL
LLATALGMSLALRADSATLAAVCPLLIALIAAWAVWQSREGFSGWAGFVLAWWPVAYLGRISYGIYVYHMLAHELLNRMPLLWRLTGSGWTGFCRHLAITVALAALSYHLLEQPILNRSRKLLTATA